MKGLLASLCVAALLPLTLIVLYQWTLAVIALAGPDRRKATASRRARFRVLIPAHDEEASLAATLQSLRRVRYSPELVDVIVVADRCSDGTATVARHHGARCLERRGGPAGKGAVIAWAIEELRKDGADADALIVLDADTVADPGLLEAFSDGLASGHRVQQAYNYLSNPWETPFTRLIAVTSVLRNGLFYSGKSRIGLSGMLTGTGMCFSHATMVRHGWTAFSVGEDWEFSASLLLESEKIYFNPVARVFARESGTFTQASTQRLRWASGRYAVAATTVWKLLDAGIRRRCPHIVDAALTLVSPTYAVQAAIATLALATACFVTGPSGSPLLPVWAALVVASLSAYFLLGVALTEAPVKTLLGIALIPVFLPWRISIEVLGLLGYGRGRWIRTARFAPPRHASGE
jgi:cellulose synthase/poly-beta-1,6-N-acetylglucosamine synthase-like glycosyltransferase